MTTQKILITSALPYANGPLHFGHIAGAYLPADCYARFERLRDKEVLYICGSDEYGMAITLSAELERRSPKAQADYYHRVNSDFFKQLNVSFDHFSRTTTPEHVTFTQKFFTDLLEGGYIEDRVTDQLFSEADNRFLADRYVVGTCPKCGYEEARGDECGRCGANYEATDLEKPRSKLTSAPLIRKPTRHWFLLFDKFKEPLAQFLTSRGWKPNVVNFAKHYIEEIRPRSITRDLEWGVPVPLEGAEEKVFYVWFDAPIGYISATHEWANLQGESEKWKEFWCDPKTHYVQFIGKDNIPFHALFFPAMIMGQKEPYKLVDELVANEFYNLEGRQFSKSEGWVIDLKDFFETFSSDQIRYAIAASSPETADSEFTWKEFQMRCNQELLGKLGNLVNRTLVFAKNNCQGLIPARNVLEEADNRFLNEMHRILLDIEDYYANYRMRKASQSLMELAQLGNGYFDTKMPWKDVKEEKLYPTMETTIHLCLLCIKNLAIISSPIIPNTAQSIWELLGLKGKVEEQSWKSGLEAPLVAGTSLPKPKILFQKVEDKLIEKNMETLKKMHEKASQTSTLPLTPLKEEVSFEDFQKLDFRVGVITKAEKVEKSKKLLLLEVDIGLERRSLVSGISKFYEPEALVGKKVVVVANLKPAKIMGVESCGMVLAGCIDTSLELVSVQELPAGAEIS